MISETLKINDKINKEHKFKVNYHASVDEKRVNITFIVTAIDAEAVLPQRPPPLSLHIRSSQQTFNAKTDSAEKVKRVSASFVRLM